MTLDYPITRPFQWRWIGPLSFAGACIAIILLTILNVALVGYETITVFNSDFLVTQKFWYDKFMPYRSEKAGELCGTRVFNVGDRFTTSYSIFEWAIQSIEKPNAGISGVAYNGSALSDCDVSAIYINGDLRTWSIDFSIVTSCKSGGTFDVSATTSFTISSLPGVLAPLLGYSRAMNSQLNGDGRAIIVDGMIRVGSEDIGTRAYTSLVNSNGTSPIVFSVQAFFEHCPASKSNTDCAKQAPKFNATNASMVYSNGVLVENFYGDNGASPRVLDDLITAPLFNLIQTAYAGARIDLGIDSANNFFLHKDALPIVLNKTFPVTPTTPANAAQIGLQSHLYTAWENPSDYVVNYPWLANIVPLNVTNGPAIIQVVYLCQFQSRKSPGTLVVSVLVATLSMFSSGWAIYLFIITSIAKRAPQSDTCQGHLIDSLSGTPQLYGKI